jgi:hypothetical protein
LAEGLFLAARRFLTGLVTVNPTTIVPRVPRLRRSPVASLQFPG